MEELSVAAEPLGGLHKSGGGDTTTRVPGVEGTLHQLPPGLRSAEMKALFTPGSKGRSMVQGARQRSTSPQREWRSQSPETRWTTQSAAVPADDSEVPGAIGARAWIGPSNGHSAVSPEAFRGSGVSDPLQASGGGGGGSDPVAEARESLRREMVESERMMRDMTGRSAAVRGLPPPCFLLCVSVSRVSHL